jgi:hypothetical protein
MTPQERAVMAHDPMGEYQDAAKPCRRPEDVGPDQRRVRLHLSRDFSHAHDANRDLRRCALTNCSHCDRAGTWLCLAVVAEWQLGCEKLPNRDLAARRG